MASKAFCYDQKFGHNFATADGKCGIGQNELGGGLQKIEYFVKKPAKGIHSEAHALAKEISEFCGEPKKFGMYLGIIKNMGLARAYQVFAEMKQGKEIKTPGKLFLYLSAYKPRAAKRLETGAKGQTKKLKKNKKRNKLSRSKIKP